MQAPRCCRQSVAAVVRRDVTLAHQGQDRRWVRPDIGWPRRQPVIGSRQRFAQLVWLQAAEDRQRGAGDAHRTPTVLDAIGDVSAAIPAFEKERAISPMAAITIVVAEPA